MASNMELSIGIIGAGSIGTRHVSNLEVMGDVTVSAVCDTVPSQLETLAGRAKAHAYTDIAEMFKREPDLDAVVICVPPVIRQQIFELAAAHEVAVFCEKPPASSMEDAQAVARIVRDSGMICSVGFNWRYSPAVQYMRRLLHEQPAQLVLSTFLSGGGSVVGLRREASGNWFFKKAISGGPNLDQAIHVIDQMRFLMGEIVKVQTFATNLIPKSQDFTVEDTTSTNLQFASGATGMHVHSWGTPPPGDNRFKLIGLDYWLELKPYTPAQVQGSMGDTSDNLEEIDKTFAQDFTDARNERVVEPPDPWHYEEIKVFLDAVRTRDTSRVHSSYDDGMRSLAVVLAMNRSIDSGEAEAIGELTP